jgi:hypothetical protein
MVRRAIGPTTPPPDREHRLHERPQFLGRLRCEREKPVPEYVMLDAARVKKRVNGIVEVGAVEFRVVERDPVARRLDLGFVYVNRHCRDRSSVR